jgi:ribosome biogenesis protein YTM1
LRLSFASTDAVGKAPLHVMKSHTARVSRALFSPLVSTPHVAYSCGLDSTFRTWDASVGMCTSTIVRVLPCVLINMLITALQTLSEKPLTDLALLTDGATALCASTDRTVSILDLRTSTASAAPAATLAHPALPSALAAHPTDAWRAMSAAYDGVVRVWDLRSVRASVASFKAEKGGKVLSVDWGRGLGALGGEDGVEVWKIGEGGERVE